jgi:hypothetical protein
MASAEQRQVIRGQGWGRNSGYRQVEGSEPRSKQELASRLNAINGVTPSTDRGSEQSNSSTEDSESDN